MNNLELQSLGLRELDAKEMVEMDGGIIPMVPILVCWGIMTACSLIALGMREALNEHNHK